MSRTQIVQWYAVFGWFPVLAWCGFIFWMSSKSDVPDPGIWLPPHTDKLVHACIYAVLSTLVYLVLRASAWSAIRSAIFAVVASSMYGVTDELHQTLVPNRVADVYDWLADTVGACIVFLYVRYNSILRKCFRWFHEPVA